MISFIHLAGCGHTAQALLRVISEHSKILFIPVESGMYLANNTLTKLRVAEYTDTVEMVALNLF